MMAGGGIVTLLLIAAGEGAAFIGTITSGAPPKVAGWVVIAVGMLLMLLTFEITDPMVTEFKKIKE